MNHKLLSSLIAITALFGTVTQASDMKFYSEHSKGWFYKEQPPLVSETEVPSCIAGKGSVFWDSSGITHTFIKKHTGGAISRDQFGQLSLLPFESINCKPPKIASLKPATPQKMEQAAKQEATPPTPSEPPPLTAKWFREKLDEYKDAAIDDPTNHQKVRAYLYLQRVMMDKAEQFTNTYQQVVMGDPFLDETNRFPVASYAVKEYEKIAKKNKEKVIKEIGKTAGLFFFFDKSCSMCDQQAYVLSIFSKQFGINIIPVSMDGAELKPGRLPAPLRDGGQSKLMGVTQYPALVLASPSDNKFKAIGQGSVFAMDELYTRTLLAAKSLAIITPETFDTTLPATGSHKLLQARSELFSEEILKDPNLLVEEIRKMGALQDEY